MRSNRSSLHKSLLFVSITLLATFSRPNNALAQKHRVPTGGRVAVVVDERLSALRAAPNVSARLVERLSRGRFVAIIGRTQSADGLSFYQVKATRRKGGWIQSNALVSAAQSNSDRQLLRLIVGSDDFDLLARARIFLDTFPQSTLRPAVLLLFGNAAEEATAKLSRDAARRLNEDEMKAGGAPEFSYFMNFNELDRYNRQGIRFVFDATARQFHYNGAAWREIVRRYPQSPEAAEARKRLAAMTSPIGK
jgi:hypothetical protein